MELKHIIEGLIFAAQGPLSAAKLAELLPEHDAAQIEAALEALAADYQGRGIELRRVAGGFQFRTAAELAGAVARLRGQTLRLSQAALETLAVVAYRQPVTRAQIEAVRGVDCSHLLRALLKRRLLRIAGRKDVPGRPPLYATTKTFLEVFDLEDLSHLPSLAEGEALSAPFAGTANPRARSRPEPNP